MMSVAAVLFAAGRPASTYAFQTATSPMGLAGRRLSNFVTTGTGTCAAERSLRWGQSKSSNKYSTRMFSASTAELSDEQKSVLESKIKETGDKIRALKDEGADKTAIAPVVEELLALKAELDPTFKKKPKKKQQQQQQQQPKQKKQQKQNQQQKKGKQKGNGDDDDNSDFITARAVDYSKWYNDIIRVTDLAETSPVRGCMVIKPWGMSLWDKIRTDLDARIKEHGAENAYFPLLIPKSFLSKEAEHVDGFAKECAVVTHHRLKASDEEGGGLIADPEAELEDPLIIRPTSETMIWYMFRKWINSHR
jgi:prolyl-tRNA synthetase